MGSKWGAFTRPSTSPEGNRPPRDSHPSQFASPPTYPGMAPAGSEHKPEPARRPRRHSTEISVDLRDAVSNQTLGQVEPPRRHRHTYEVGVVAVGGSMSRDDRTAAMELRQKVLPAGEYGEFAAAPEVDSSFGRNVTRRRGTHATFGSEARGAVIPQIAEGHSQTSGHAQLLLLLSPNSRRQAQSCHHTLHTSRANGCLTASGSTASRAPLVRPPLAKMESSDTATLNSHLSPQASRSVLMMNGAVRSAQGPFDFFRSRQEGKRKHPLRTVALQQRLMEEQRRLAAQRRLAVQTPSQHEPVTSTATPSRPSVPASAPGSLGLYLSTAPPQLLVPSRPAPLSDLTAVRHEWSVERGRLRPSPPPPKALAAPAYRAALVLCGLAELPDHAPAASSSVRATSPIAEPWKTSLGATAEPTSRSAAERPGSHRACSR